MEMMRVASSKFEGQATEEGGSYGTKSMLVLGFEHFGVGIVVSFWSIWQDRDNRTALSLELEKFGFIHQVVNSECFGIE